MNPQERRISLHATLLQIDEAGERIRECIPAVLNEDERYMVELGVIEALNNIVLHGYRGNADGVIDVVFQADTTRLCIVILDKGEAIPNDKLASADMGVFDFNPEVLDTVPEGGMGLALLHAAFDEVGYASANGQNALKLIKRLPDSTS